MAPVPRTPVVQACAGGWAQRLLGASQRQYDSRRPPSAPAAEQPVTCAGRVAAHGREAEFAKPNSDNPRQDKQRQQPQSPIAALSAPAVPAKAGGWPPQRSKGGEPRAAGLGGHERRGP